MKTKKYLSSRRQPQSCTTGCPHPQDDVRVLVRYVVRVFTAEKGMMRFYWRRTCSRRLNAETMNLLETLCVALWAESKTEAAICYLIRLCIVVVRFRFVRIR